MKLIKLGAIDSTNEFLKGLSHKQELDNFTVVIAEKQTKGKGQMGSTWEAEEGKNLIVSVFIKDPLLNINQIYNLNIAIAVALVASLEIYNIPKLSIKWPNDIMSSNFKIGGILIENSLKSDGAVSSVVGLGLNINQINFDNLPKASSLAVICGVEFDIEQLFYSIIDQMKQNIDLVQQQSEYLRFQYTEKLFKIGIPMPFKDDFNKNFMGIIQGVSADGKLRVLLEDDSISEYNLKEIQMLY
jgi:BirA family biotin operon repressor/biotin-[acetyl-CoA-carboxylase] ligase